MLRALGAVAMNTDERAALLVACRDVAKVTLWQAAEPFDITDIIDSEQIEKAVSAYYREAEQRADELEEAGHDPTIVTRAVLYLADEHALPPMKEDVRWFRESLEVLMRLVQPLSSPTAAHVAFMRDIEAAARRYREDAQ